MTNSVILIRCVTSDDRIKSLYSSLKKRLPGTPVYAVPDQLHGADTASEFLAAGVDVLPMTAEWAESQGLRHSDSNIGWLCGDYAFYRALELEWDYAWVLEPDVYFVRGAERIFTQTAQLSDDLLATHLQPGGKDWWWRPPLEDLNLGLDIHAMAFPLVRLSRRLAEEALSVRRQATNLLGDSGRYPNDESVIASVAHSRGFSIVDLRTLFPDAFRYWSTVVKYNLDDVLADSDRSPQIVHSGLPAAEFAGQFRELVAKALNGDERASRQARMWADGASKKTLISTLASLLESE